MDQKLIEEPRQKYSQTPPEGMTAKLVKNMTDSDLLDMHYFLTEDDDLDDDELKKVFTSSRHRLFLMPASARAILIQKFDASRTFLLYKKCSLRTHIGVRKKHL